MHMHVNTHMCASMNTSTCLDHHAIFVRGMCAGASPEIPPGQGAGGWGAGGGGGVLRTRAGMKVPPRNIFPVDPFGRSPGTPPEWSRTQRVVIMRGQTHCNTPHHRVAHLKQSIPA